MHIIFYTLFLCNFPLRFLSVLFALPPFYFGGILDTLLLSSALDRISITVSLQNCRAMLSRSNQLNLIVITERYSEVYCVRLGESHRASHAHNCSKVWQRNFSQGLRPIPTFCVDHSERQNTYSMPDVGLNIFLYRVPRDRGFVSG